jgi:hypothetical protein
MEELKPQDIEDLLQEREEGDGAQESLPQEVEELLRVLQSGSAALDRRDAAEDLGKVGTSNPRIVRVLIGAYESDPSSMVNRAAAKSLRALAHQEYLQQHPDLMEATERALQERPGADRQRSRPNTIRPTDLETQLKSIRWYDDPFGLALAARAILALKRALQQASRKGETGRGVSDPQARSLIRCMAASSVAGFAVGLVLGWYAAQPYDATVCWALLLVPLIVGAAVGAVVQGRKDRIAGIATGVAFSAAVAWLSGFVIFLWRIIRMGGP